MTCLREKHHCTARGNRNSIYWEDEEHSQEVKSGRGLLKPFNKQASSQRNDRTRKARDGKKSKREITLTLNAEWAKNALSEDAS